MARRLAPILVCLVVVAAGCATVRVVSLETIQDVPGISVSMHPQPLGSESLILVIRNHGARDWTVLWDESSYVTPDGQAVRLQVSGLEQSSPRRSPLPAGSLLQQHCRLAQRSLAAGLADAQTSGDLVLVLLDGDHQEVWRGRAELERTIKTRPARQPDGPSWAGD